MRAPGPARGRRGHADRHRGRVRAHRRTAAWTSTRPDVRADLAALRDGGPVRPPCRAGSSPVSPRGARPAPGPLAVVSCDNLPGNGAVTARVVADLAETVDPAARATGSRDHVSFVTTMVDRITPRTTADDVRAVAEQTGWADAVPVVTEPFTEWVLSGDVPGRPPGVGRRRGPVRRRRPPARDAQAAAAQRRTQPAGVRGQRARPRHHRGGGRRTRSAAAGWTEWWDEAVPVRAAARRRAGRLPGGAAGRFANPRIRHTLAQIAADGSQKVPIRVLPVLRGERAAGRMPAGAVRILAAWIDHLRGIGAPVDDAGAGPYRERAGSRARRPRAAGARPGRRHGPDRRHRRSVALTRRRFHG